MQHCMAVGTNRTQVLYRIDLVANPYCRERNQMVNVNIVDTDTSVTLLKIESRKLRTERHSGRYRLAERNDLFHTG